MNNQQVQIKRDDLKSIITYAFEVWYFHAPPANCMSIVKSTTDENEQQAILEQLLRGLEQLDADTLIIAAK